ncbi:MAG TPA: fibronectin type III domain-containing protein, partial [Bacteroidales bacterium]|nr:fibronectin type III domain-containing protein [Bacteroidales bacterium]HPS71767.1 fibronectin type III domain-containing protein [Bacteroidales bacterium]
SWVIEYGPVGFTQGTGTVVPNVTTNPYTLTGLTPNTTYQFYVQSNCSGNYSAYSNAVTLTTGLIPINLPYTNDFENPLTYTDFGFLNGTQANKWTIGSATGVNNTVGGTNAMYISNDNGTTWAYTAGTVGNSKVYAYMDINVPTGANEILLDFDWIAQGSSAQYDFLRVYMMPITIPVTAGNIPPTVNSVNYDLTAMIGHYTGGPGDHWLSVQSTWQHKQFNINSTQFPNLAGNTWRLYFHWRNDQTNAVQPPATIDNISIVISTCPAPSALAVTNVSSSSVELGWTENGSATTWTVEYGPAGFTLGTGTQVIASANPFVVPGLNPATIYDFYVKANCGASDFSGWTNKVTATTSCVPVALPIIEGFESSLSIPTCWTTTYTLNNFNVTTTGTSPTCSPNGGSNMLRFNSFNTTAGNHAVLYSPLINVTGDSISVSYWQYRDPGYNGAQYATEGIEVFYNTTPSLTGATSLGFTSRSFATAGWYQISYIIPSGLIGNAFVIFKATSEYGNNQFIDDISIAYTTIVPCTVPTNLAVSAITTSTATATWTAGGSETQWEVAYKPTSASTWNSAFVTAPTYNFSTLTAATVYDVKVRAICEVGDTSAYTAVVNFTTATPPCNVPTNLQVPTATITDQSAIFTWTAGGTETQWQVEYKLVSSTNWTTMPISTTTTQLIQALQSNSTYEVRVKALCGTGNESPFTTPIQFTTTGAGTYTITTSVSGSGTITPSGDVIVNAGADQEFIFTPGEGTTVVLMLIDGVITPCVNNSYTFQNVMANHTLEVTFAEGIENNNLSNLVSLYPNPTNSTIELKINQTQLQVRECQLYDIYGKLIKVITITEENTKIDVSEYASGVYFVRMNTEMGPISKKFVKK